MVESEVDGVVATKDERGTEKAPICCVMPPASPEATDVCRSESSSVVLP